MSRTYEYMTILQRRFGDKLIIEFGETSSEWNTYYYDVTLGVRDLVLTELKNKPDRLKDFAQYGLASCLDLRSVFCADTLEVAAENLFYYCQKLDLLHED